MHTPGDIINDFYSSVYSIDIKSAYGEIVWIDTYIFYSALKQFSGAGKSTADFIIILGSGW